MGVFGASSLLPVLIKCFLLLMYNHVFLGIVAKINPLVL